MSKARKYTEIVEEIIIQPNDYTAYEIKTYDYSVIYKEKEYTLDHNGNLCLLCKTVHKLEDWQAEDWQVNPISQLVLTCVLACIINNNSKENYKQVIQQSYYDALYKHKKQYPGSTLHLEIEKYYDCFL